MSFSRALAFFVCLLLGIGCGGTSGGIPPILPPSGNVPGVVGAGTHPALGLVTAVPSETAVRFGWRVVDLPSGAPAAALFVGLDPENLLSEAPVPVSPGDGAMTTSGLVTGATYFGVIAFDDGMGGWSQSGPTLRVRTAAPIFVLSGANPDAANGQSPATAWETIERGIEAAAAAGGGNVWTSGNFTTPEIHVPANVDLYGGFDQSFDLANRDVSSRPTRVTGLGTSSIITLDRADGSVAVLDGFQVDGAGVSDACIDVEQRHVELRSIAAGRSSRGYRLRSDDTSQPVEVSMVRCLASVCVAGGVSLAGAFDLRMEDCTMSGNGQEGLTADSLTGISGGVSRLIARDCDFSRNGAEGLDVDLVAPGGSGSGRWVVRLEDCVFEDNLSDGCLLDCDYEGEVGWFSRFEIVGCEVRGNRMAGVHIDADAQSTTHLYRTLAVGNATDGVLISSETAPGTVLVDACALIGNQRFGLRTEMGNVGILVTHSVVGGNRLGGLRAGVAPIFATSTIAYEQATPWVESLQAHESLVSSAAGAPVFANAPRAWYPVASYSTGVLTLATPPAFDVGADVEVGDDGVGRTVRSVSSSIVTLVEGPSQFLTPGVVAWFDSADTGEDWSLALGSPAAGSGMANPGGQARDAGPFGSPAGGAPGRLDLVPTGTFRLAETIPSWSRSVSPTETIVLRFDGKELDSGSTPGGIDVVDSSGAPVLIDLLTAGGVAIISPQATWATGDRIQVHDTLRAIDGTPLSASVAIPLTVGP